MQAHTQSNRAARDPLQAPSFPTASSTVSGLSRSSAVPSLGPTVVPSSVANGIGLAHDAGNLFAALGLYCDLLSAQGVLSPEHQHYVTELRQIAERSQQLVNNLMTGPVATAEPAVLPPPQGIVNAADVLRQIEPLLTAIAGHSVDVSFRAPRSLPTPPIPAETLERILVNLVRNAAQAIECAGPRPLGGHIRVTLATLAGHLRLTVEDNGPGMPVTTAAAFLSPKPLPAGARHGLGHRIIHDLVSSSGGTLSLRVRPGRGTIISIQWPVPAASTPVHPETAGATISRGNRRLGAVTC